MDSKSFREYLRHNRIQRNAIEHWTKNLKIIKKMDWDRWYEAGWAYRRMMLVDGSPVTYPQIYSTDCPYCEEVRDMADHVHCDQCPLWEYKNLDAKHKPSCCNAWNKVQHELLCPDKDKTKAITAVVELINYIKEVGEW